MTTESTKSTKFFIELPADERGNTGMMSAVVEGTLIEENGREKLVPVAPEEFVQGWPNGWYRDGYGGWAEIEGPARLLSYEEHKALLAALTPEDLEGAKSGLVTLKNGETMPRLMVSVMMISLQDLIAQHPMAFYELVMSARSREHVLSGTCGEELVSRGLLESVDDQGRGRMHDETRSIVTSAATGDDLELALTSPIAA